MRGKKIDHIALHLKAADQPSRYEPKDEDNPQDEPVMMAGRAGHPTEIFFTRKNHRK
jgi:hypothetical protein